MSRWPKDDPNALMSFYGNPGNGEVARQLVRVTPPFQMYYDKKPIKAILFHQKAAPALLNALNDIWDSVGHDQKKLDKLGVSAYGGAYNPRKVRGSATKWSNHAFGAAIDLDPDNNGFNTGHGRMPQFVIDAFKRQGARWGGDYHHRTDPMHFEFCDPGDATHPLAFADLAPDEVPDVPDGGAEVDDSAPKPSGFQELIRSKIAWLQGLIGSTGVGAVLSSDDGLWDKLDAIIRRPSFWVVLLILAGVGATIYFRWRDHGGGR